MQATLKEIMILNYLNINLKNKLIEDKDFK